MSLNMSDFEEAPTPGANATGSKGPKDSGGSKAPGAVSMPNTGYERNFYRRVQTSCRNIFRQPHNSINETARSDQSHLPPEMRIPETPAPSAKLSVFEQAQCEPVHDSPQETEGITKKDIFMLLCGGIVILAIGLGVVFAMSSKIDDAGSGEPIVTEETGDDTFKLSPRESALKSQLEYLLSDPSIFFDDSSPQYEALAWLAEEEGAMDDQARLETRFALATIFYSTTGENWHDGLNFLSSDHECDWSSQGQGVKCNHEDQVTSLIVDGNNLRGSIPEELMVLSNLEELRLSNNTHGRDDNKKNSISNPKILPSLGSLTNLKILDLSRNLLEYVIPSEFGQLTNLESLYLNHNRIKNFMNIKELNNLTNLKHLVLNDNNLQGFTDSDAMQDMVSLEELNVARNPKFEIPENITFATNLKILNLELTRMVTFISTEIGHLTNLEHLFMGGTAVRPNGLIPTEIGLLTSLQTLDLEWNKLGGTVPSTMGAMTSLVTVDFTGNHMTGELPRELGLLKSLDTLRLRGNDFIGDIDFLCNEITNLNISVSCIDEQPCCTCCSKCV